MDFSNLDIDELQRQEADANQKKAVINTLGSIASNFDSAPSAYDLLVKKSNVGTGNSAKMYDQAAKAVVDPIESAKSGYDLWKKNHEAKLGQVNLESATRDNEMAKSGMDPNSQKSKNTQDAYRGFLQKAGMSDDQINRLSHNDVGDVISNKIKIEDLKDKHFDRMARLDAMRGAQAERAAKQKELSSGLTKQQGTFNMGALAEDQYSNAVADKNNYDPTESGQWIDNSSWAPNWMKNDKAIEAQNAQSAWVESFLRDASGAAIAPSERLAYAKDFFPQPGDTQSVVDNKALLRKQKMANAALGGGHEFYNQAVTKMNEPKSYVNTANAQEMPKVKEGDTKAYGGKVFVVKNGRWIEQKEKARP